MLSVFANVFILWILHDLYKRHIKSEAPIQMNWKEATSLFQFEVTRLFHDYLCMHYLFNFLCNDKLENLSILWFYFQIVLFFFNHCHNLSSRVDFLSLFNNCNHIRGLNRLKRRELYIVDLMTDAWRPFWNPQFE